MELIDAPELARWLKNTAETKPILLDVREYTEVQLCQIPDSLHIPMHSIPDRMRELNMDSPIVCICHHGVRSRQVAFFLEQHGFEKVVNLTGGIHAWATQVDLEMARY